MAIAAALQAGISHFSNRRKKRHARKARRHVREFQRDTERRGDIRSDEMAAAAGLHGGTAASQKRGRLRGIRHDIRSGDLALAAQRSQAKEDRYLQGGQLLGNLMLGLSTTGRGRVAGSANAVGPDIWQWMKGMY